jgi:hypothetical protein
MRFRYNLPNGDAELSPRGGERGIWTKEGQDFSVRASPSTPESPPGRFSIILLRRFWFHPLWEPDHSQVEAVSEFAFATARTFVFRGSDATTHAVTR